MGLEEGDHIKKQEGGVFQGAVGRSIGRNWDYCLNFVRDFFPDSDHYIILYWITQTGTSSFFPLDMIPLLNSTWYISRINTVFM